VGGNGKDISSFGHLKKCIFLFSARIFEKEKEKTANDVGDYIIQS
jgi:hypothetical protein